MKQNKINSLLFFLIIIVFMVFMVSGGPASGGNPIYQVEFLNNRLTVNVANVSLGSVLAKVQEKTGIRFVLDKGEADKRISVSFQPLPIDRALD